MFPWIIDGAKPEDCYLCNAATSRYRTDQCVCDGGWMPLQYNCPHTALAASARGLPAVKSRNYSVGLVFPISTYFERSVPCRWKVLCMIILEQRGKKGKSEVASSIIIYLRIGQLDVEWFVAECEQPQLQSAAERRWVCSKLFEGWQINQILSGRTSSSCPGTF